MRRPRCSVLSQRRVSQRVLVTSDWDCDGRDGLAYSESDVRGPGSCTAPDRRRSRSGVAIAIGVAPRAPAIPGMGPTEAVVDRPADGNEISAGAVGRP